MHKASRNRQQKVFEPAQKSIANRRFFSVRLFIVRFEKSTLICNYLNGVFKANRKELEECDMPIACYDKCYDEKYRTNYRIFP